VRVGDGGGAKGSLRSIGLTLVIERDCPRFWMNAEPVWISRDCGSNTIQLRSFKRREATSHPEKESDMVQTHGVLICLYEVLLHAECEEAVSYAQATYVARDLIDRSAEHVDSED
jgi:hypothetical protein